MTRCRVELDEINHDRTGYRSNIIPDIESIFTDSVDELGPEPIPRMKGKWKKGPDGFEVFVEDK